MDHVKNRAHLHLKPQLLLKLPAYRVPGVLACLDFAAGELPQQRLPLGDQNPVAPQDQRRRHIGGQIHASPPFLP